jgi:hypothetical protein
MKRIKLTEEQIVLKDVGRKTAIWLNDGVYRRRRSALKLEVHRVGGLQTPLVERVRMPTPSACWLKLLEDLLAKSWEFRHGRKL